jgi:hypothetical protein
MHYFERGENGVSRFGQKTLEFVAERYQKFSGDIARAAVDRRKSGIEPLLRVDTRAWREPARADHIAYYRVIHKKYLRLYYTINGGGIQLLFAFLPIICPIGYFHGLSFSSFARSFLHDPHPEQDEQSPQQPEPFFFLRTMSHTANAATATSSIIIAISQPFII